MKDLSVIIVSWNARNFLRDCLKSIENAGDQSVREIIVVDNGSSDGSADMVAGEFPEVRLIRVKDNLGFARANNIGLKEASGTWLALINSDVVVHPNCLQTLGTFLETHPDVGLVGPKVFGADGSLQRTCRRLPTVWNTFCRCLALDDLLPQWPLFSGTEMRHWNQETQGEIEVLSGCFWVARRQAVESVGGLDERFFFYAEDVDWCKRFRQQGWKVVFVPAASATHFGGGSSAGDPVRYSIEMLRANFAYWGKHYGLPGRAVFLVLSMIHQVLRFAGFGLKSVIEGNRNAETVQKRRRSVACLLWLFTGRSFVVEKKYPQASPGATMECCKAEKP